MNGYYAVAGKNAYGVYTNYTKMQKDRTYIAAFRCQRCDSYEEAKQAIYLDLKSFASSDTIILLSGGCRGADQLGERFAKEVGWEIEYYMPEWKKYGRAAGPLRNKCMIEKCDAVICFWDGKSKGTGSLIQYAQKFKKQLFLHMIGI